MIDFGRLLEKIDDERLLTLLTEAINAYSPTFSEEPALQVFTRAFQHACMACQLQPLPPRFDQPPRKNLIVHLGPDPPGLLLVGHVDTVEIWHEGSHQARRDSDRLFGLGTADMKGGCAAMAEAVLACAASDLPLRRGLCLALVVGEEEDGDGSQTLVESVQAPLAVIGEPSGLRPCTAHFGYCETRLVCQGVRSHAALPENGASAIHAMLEWILQIITAASRRQIAVNPREIHGGESGFVVAEHCEAFIDFHVPPDVPPGVLDTLISEAATAAGAGHSAVTLRHENGPWAAGFTCNGDAPVLACLQTAFELVHLPWAPDVFRSHSDAHLFHGNGIPTVICGPGDLALAHTRDEWVSIAEVQQAARVYAAMIWSCCIAPDVSALRAPGTGHASDSSIP